MKNNAAPITELLGDLSDGKSEALEELMPLVYSRLQDLAHQQLYKERGGHTLNTTALVHEAYFKLIGQSRIKWQNRAHFYAIVAQAMRRILINYAEKRNAQKRGSGEVVAVFNDELFAQEAKAGELLALDEALEQLSKFSDRQAKVVEYRFFGGLTQEEIAEVLKVSVATVRLDWRLARAWLTREMERNLNAPPK